MIDYLKNVILFFCSILKAKKKSKKKTKPEMKGAVWEREHKHLSKTIKVE